VVALGLTQAQLASLAGLSRATVNQLEAGSIKDLGVAKLAAVLDLVGLRLDTAESNGARSHALRMASRSASVGYRAPIVERELARAMASGAPPQNLVPHVATLLDELPLPLLVAAVEETANRSRVPAKRIWRHIRAWAKTLRSPWPAWR
jgi:transcriptional regulator with XRE-family HTH domain